MIWLSRISAALGPELLCLEDGYVSHAWYFYGVLASSCVMTGEITMASTLFFTGKRKK